MHGVPLFRRTAHLQQTFPVVKGTYVQVCAALQPDVPQSSRKLFMDATSVSAAGRVGRSAQTQKSQIAKNRNFKIKPTKPKSRKLSSNFVSTRSTSKLFTASSYFCSSKSAARFWLLRPLRSIRNVRGAYLMRANSVPMKRRHSTWLNSHGSEERT